MNRRSRFVATAGLCLALVLATCAPAYASPFSARLSSKQAQVKRVQKQLALLDNKAEIATENYNAARDRYDTLTGKVRSLNAKIKRLKSRTSKLQGHLNDRATAVYRQGPLGILDLMLSSRSLEALIATMHYSNELNRRDATTVSQLKATKATTVATRKRLLVVQAQAKRNADAMASNERAVKAQIASRQQLLSGLTLDIATLVSQQQAAEAAAAQVRAAAILALQASRAAPSADASGSGNAPVSGKGAKAVWWAESQLGKPYVWGASGPGSFDCSGLTMWAYRHVGVSLPHHAADQIGRGRRISRSNLKPGDLVFFGSPIHHVGMYVGHGDFIEAPHSGANVRISVLANRMGDYVGACRP